MSTLSLGQITVPSVTGLRDSGGRRTSERSDAAGHVFSPRRSTSRRFQDS